LIGGTDAWFLSAIKFISMGQENPSSLLSAELTDISITLLQLETSEALKSALPSFSLRHAKQHGHPFTY
jgi:hypothetical protein